MRPDASQSTCAVSCCWDVSAWLVFLLLFALMAQGHLKFCDKLAARGEINRVSQLLIESLISACRDSSHTCLY